MVLVCVEQLKFIFNKWRDFGIQSKCLTLDATLTKTELLKYFCDLIWGRNRIFPHFMVGQTYIMSLI